jgi:hypothetical protein
MSATIIRNVTVCKFACYASLRKRALITAILFTSYSCYLTISFRCVDVRGLRI